MADPRLTPEQMTELIRAMEEAKAAYVPTRADFYLGIMHGMQHAIYIVRRASSEPAGRSDGS